MSPEFPIALYYFTFLGALGIFWPYFTLYLASVGLSPTEITQVMSVYPLMGLVGPPLFGLLADARRARGWLLRLASFGTLVAFTGFFRAGASRPALYLTTAAFAFFRGPLLSMTDATAFDCVAKHGGSYGRLRLWGSVGFLLGALGAGALLQSYGVIHMLEPTSAGLLLAAGCAWLMPAPPPERRPRVIAAWVGMLRSGRLWLLLSAVTLAQTAGAAYDSCFSLHLRSLGYGAQFVGGAWAIGVGAEVVLMLWSAPLIRRFGADRLFALALGVAALRWLCIAHVRAPLLLLALQPLHGITFGFFYVAGVTLVRDRGGPEAPTAAQGLFAGALGLGSMTGMQLAGHLFESSAGLGLFTAASCVATLATACAIGYAFVLRRPRPSAQ